MRDTVESFDTFMLFREWSQDISATPIPYFADITEFTTQPSTENFPVVNGSKYMNEEKWFDFHLTYPANVYFDSLRYIDRVTQKTVYLIFNKNETTPEMHYVMFEADGEPIAEGSSSGIVNDYDQFIATPEGEITYTHFGSQDINLFGAPRKLKSLPQKILSSCLIYVFNN